MKEFKEKEILKYVIATLDNPTQYLISGHFGKWSFTDNIAIATKTNNKFLANTLKEYFYRDTNVDFDMVILPLKIEYKLMNEFDDN